MITDFLLPAALAFIMFSVGLSLKPADFRQVFTRSRGLVIGLIGQLMLVPIAALAVVSVMGLPPALAVGLLILAACPGGASSAFLTQLARGNTALSLTLTVISSLSALLTFPLLVELVFAHLGGDALSDGMRQLGNLPVGKLMASVLTVTTLPILLGMQVRRGARAFTERRERLIGRLATAFFVAIVLGTFLAHRQTILANLAAIGPATVVLNVVVMACSFALVAAFGSGRRDAIAVAMECGLQNAGLGIYVAIALLRQPELAVPSVVYALTMNIGALAVVLLSRLRGVRRAVLAG